MFLFGSMFGYPFWQKMAGSPEDQARLIRSNPAAALCKTARFIEDPSGKSIAVISDGSGITSVALSLLGAEVTLFGSSEGVEQYARELAEAAGVPMRVMIVKPEEIDLEQFGEQFDIVYPEGAVLHFNENLRRAVKTLKGLLKPGGKLVVGIYPPDANLARIMFFDQPGLLRPEEADYMKAQIMGAGEMPLMVLEKNNAPAILAHTMGLFHDFDFKILLDDEDVQGIQRLIATKDIDS